MGLHLQHGCVEVHAPHEGHQALLLGLAVEQVHHRALAAAHAAVDVQPCSEQLSAWFPDVTKCKWLPACSFCWSRLISTHVVGGLKDSADQQNKQQARLG